MNKWKNNVNTFGINTAKFHAFGYCILQILIVDLQLGLIN